MLKKLLNKELYMFQFTEADENKVKEILYELPIKIVIEPDRIYMEQYYITPEERKYVNKIFTELTGLDSISKIEIAPYGIYIERTVVEGAAAND